MRPRETAARDRDKVKPGAFHVEGEKDGWCGERVESNLLCSPCAQITPAVSVLTTVSGGTALPGNAGQAPLCGYNDAGSWRG